MFLFNGLDWVIVDVRLLIIRTRHCMQCEQHSKCCQFQLLH